MFFAIFDSTLMLSGFYPVPRVREGLHRAVVQFGYLGSVIESSRADCYGR